MTFEGRLQGGEGESDGSLGNSQGTGLELEEAGLVGDEVGDQEEVGVAGGEGERGGGSR